MKIIEPSIGVEPYDGIAIMKKIERACRTCYKSEDKITDTSYKNLLSNCINRGHESVMEHALITVRMICDIGVYKDLTRHRFGSFSIESTRYCNYSKDRFNNEIQFIRPMFYLNDWKYNELDEIIKDPILYKCYIWENCMKSIEQDYNAMSEIGATSDELRMILPHSTAAEVTMTANIREWRHILSLRANKHAHPSVQQLMIPLLRKFQEDMPELFNSIEYNKEFGESRYAKLYIIGENDG